ncbi:MAG: ABC transporter permease [Vicinamibacterales bacterium]
MSATRRMYRGLARLLPRHVREEGGGDLELAAVACLEAARARRGRPGVTVAWVGLVADVAFTAVAARRDAARSRILASSAAPRRGVIERMLDNLRKDLRFAVRSLVRQPGFTLVTVLTLALGIGANTAVFSVLNGVILRPLPYPQPERLVYITSQFPTLDFDQFWVSPPEFVEYRERNQVMASVGAYSVGSATLGSDPPSRPVRAQVTPDLLETLGVPPMAGRPFEAADSAPGAAPVAILSWELWQRGFGGDRDVVGRDVLINNVSTRIVGVMPAGFDVHDQKIELWTPFIIDPAQLPGRRGNHLLYLIGRLAPGVTMAQAQADLERQLADWQTLAPNSHTPSPDRHRLRIDPLKEDMVGSVRRALVILQAAVAFVLLIACANLANLLIARADTRSREYAVRSALGASRGRIFVQLVTEGLVIAVLAAIVGTGLAWAGLTALLTVNPDAIPRTAEVSLDWMVLGFTLGVAMLTAFVFGLVPLAHLSKGSVGQALKDAGGRSAAGSVRTGLRSMLVIGEVALAVMLVAGAGLLIRSFVNLMQVDLGFDRAQLSTFRVVLPGNAYDPPAQVAFYDRLLGELRAIPGVTSAALTSGLPPLRSVDANDTDFEHIPNNRPPGTQPAENVDFWQGISLDYVDTMGIPVVEGRGFERPDLQGPPVALVNETLARRFFEDRSPIGAHVKPGFGDGTPWLTIVGVLKDVKQGGVDSGAGTQLFLLNDQLPRVAGFSYSQMNVVVRSPLPLDALAPQFRRIMHGLDAALPIVNMRTMDEVVGESVARPRFLTLLLGVLAALALALAAVGTYGILSYLVTERRKEIGIRMALGADRRQVLGLVLGRGLLLSGLGLAAGLVGATALTRVLANLLFNVTPTDPVTLGAVTVVIAAVALVACVIPAFRATRVNPIAVLRNG